MEDKNVLMHIKNLNATEQICAHYKAFILQSIKSLNSNHLWLDQNMFWSSIWSQYG